jgi:predicted PhzF superfamily epimerase YddE/YHI9
MRKVAAENNLSETAFFVSVGDRYDLRWSTPRGEVKLCGHATLASAYMVLTLLEPKLDSVRFETRHLLSMDFPALFPGACGNLPATLISALGPGPRPSKVLEVNDTYIAVYEDQSTIQNLQADFARLEELHPFAVSATAPGREVDFVSRYFKPSYGMPEDPVTGSGHCALTPYWADRLGKSQLHARQLSECGGELWCEVKGSRVLLKGTAVLTMKGTLVI